MGASGALGRLALPSARVLWLALPASALAVLLQRWLATREKDLFGGLDSEAACVGALLQRLQSGAQQVHPLSLVDPAELLPCPSSS